MEESNTHIIYTAGDIKKYLAGEMTTGQMHAIEKAALDDALLAEAIEGYAGMEEKDLAATLNELNNKLASIKSTPVVVMNQYGFSKPLKIAAVILLLVTGAVTAYLVTSRKDAVVLAAEQTIERVAADTVKNIAVNDSLPGKNLIQDSQLSAVVTQTGTNKNIQNGVSDIKSILAQADSVTQKNDFVYQPPILSKEKRSSSNSQKEYETSNIENVNPAAPDYSRTQNGLPNQANASSNAISDDILKQLPGTRQDKKDDDKFYKATSAGKNVNYFNGRVVAKDNAPVAYAQVTTNTSKQPVYTDKNGYFKVTAPDSSVNVEVNSAGYNAKKLTISQADNERNIVLEPVNIAEKKLSSGKNKGATTAAQMKEAQKKELEEQEDEEATPVVGWSDYNNYLSDNGKISDKTIHGVVEVFVNLDKNGAVSTIKVDKSLCAECDAEAVRLVKEGPKWDVKANKARKAKVKVTF